MKTRLFAAGILTALCCIVLAHAQESTLAGRAFEQLRAQPPICADHFDFVVVGDTRSSEPVILPDEFYQMIREWNILQPAFVIDTGDLILGGAVEGLGRQWDAFEDAVRQCAVPFFPVAGNHDVSDTASEALYEQRIGPLIYAFSYGNSRFIVLNTEELGVINRLSEAQLAWLAEDLAQTSAKNIFLFLHQPLFARDWDRCWAEAAAILKGYPVKAVFASHDHLYRYWGERDGVRYVISGGGGAERRTPEEDGGFVHYLLVRVRGAEADWAVIRPGSILSPEVVTQAQIDEKRRIEAAFQPQPIEVPYGEEVNRDFSIEIQNPLAETMRGVLEWEAPPGWRIMPKTRAYEAAPGETVAIGFRLRADNPGSVRFPAPVFTARPEAAVVPYTVSKPVDLIPVAQAQYAAGPVQIDGDLREWAGIPMIPLSYAHAFDIADTANLEARIRLMWDEGHLYLAVEVEDDEFYQPYAGDIVWSADNVQIFLDTWEWGLSLTAAGPEVFLYKGPDREYEKVNSAVGLAVSREGRRTIYEAAFPASEVAPLQIQEENAFRLCVVVNDLDPSVPGRPRHWVELTPGWGDIGRGPRTKVVLIR